jgi:hypothetical protein
MLPRHRRRKRRPCPSQHRLKQLRPKPRGAAQLCASVRPSASATRMAQRMSLSHRRVSRRSQSPSVRPKAMTPIGLAAPAGGAGGCLARTDHLGHPGRGKSRGSLRK